MYRFLFLLVLILLQNIDIVRVPEAIKVGVLVQGRIHYLFHVTVHCRETQDSAAQWVCQVRKDLW